MVAASDPARFLDRDIEWLEFNARVLHVAREAATPLLERVRFLAIYSNNLDEFFMKRVGGLRRQAEGSVTGGPDIASPLQQLDGLRRRVSALGHEQARILV